METFLFGEIIFGPVKSRRLGNSLGINLLPNNFKLCNYDCVYCECGWTHKDEIKTIKTKFHPLEDVQKELQKKLIYMHTNGIRLDNITFAGNGEPTLHPKFAEIIDLTIELRNKYYPEAQISVLSNATMLHNTKVFNALLKVDKNIQKLDSAFTDTIKVINRPLKHITAEEIIENLKKFNGRVIIQTLFLRGTYNGVVIDNTTDKEINKWLEAVKYVNPEEVMVYTFARNTPADTLEKVPKEELERIADKVRQSGINVLVAG
jgi:wyosine [tRNA(Phe)-imidazoG37] synthetase (radical SAM superfamily)